MTQPGFVPFERGDFKVMIACCAWGNCSRCNADGDKSKRVWWGISDGLSEAFAEHTAKSWRNFDGRVEPMDEADRARAAAAAEFFARNKPPA